MRTKFSFPLWTWSLFSSLLKRRFRRCRCPFILRSLFHYLALRARGGGGGARPPPPHAYRVSASLFPPLFAVSLIRCSANFFGDDWELGTGYRLCCDGLTPFFLSPRPLENGQTRESYETYCKARVGHEYHQRWSAWVGFQRRTIDPASFLTNISVT